MSGIGGVVRFDGRRVEADIGNVLVETLTHRGPDARGTWSADGITLVHSHLVTTVQAAHERQPFIDPAGGLVVVADLRLDNRESLLRDLDLPAESAISPGDAELVALAYRRWGRRCPQHLEGDFAFALWDANERQLFCARDPFGVKPFVYCLISGRFLAFASEVRTLLKLEDVPRQLDERRIANYLSLHFADTQSTFYRSLQRLPGAHSLHLKNGTVNIQRYWSAGDVRPLRLSSDTEYAEGYREHFGRAVKARMRTANPADLGSMLSGGLDSSAIACFARDDIVARAGQPLPVFSWIFSDEMTADEREYQAVIIASGGFTAQTLDSQTAGYSPWSDLPKFLPDGPLYAPNFYLNYGAAQWARGMGVKVMLDGAGGDSVISRGDARLVELLWKGRLFTLVRELRLLTLRQDISDTLPRAFFKRVLAPLAPHSVRRLVHRFERSSAANPGLALLRRDIAHLSGASHGSSKPCFTARQKHVAELSSPMLAEGLELFDRVYARAGVDGRYPFFDRRLVEYCVSLPADQKLAKGYSRIVARRAAEGSVPPLVQWRGGKGKPGLHIVTALRAHPSRLEELLLHKPDALAPYIDIDVLSRTYEAFAAGQPTTFATVVQLWSIAVLGWWLREHVA